MLICRHRLIHYVLIVLLMVAPVPGAVAMQQAHCDMDDMTMSSSSDTLMPSHDMAAMLSPDAAQTDTMGQENHQCCCCDGADCAGNCDMGMTVPLLMQASSYQSVFKHGSDSISISENILVRALTPPSRPPANLHH